jgi:hypothetical protein
MFSPLARYNFLHFAALGLSLTLLASSCSKQSVVAPEEVFSAEYEIKDIRYFNSSNQRLDTVPVKLQSFVLKNPSALLTTQVLDAGYEELSKTSRFTINDQSLLPPGIKLENLLVHVPERWDEKGLYGYFSEKFSLSSAEQKKPYTAYKKETLTIKIPPKSEITLDRQIQSYLLTCSFSAMVENKSTGQQYTLTGSWKGISHYNNSSVSLTEHPLK